MTTTPTFRVADGMLVENARMENPFVNNDLFCNDIISWRRACEEWENHETSLRSIPIAPGCVFESDDRLVEGLDFNIDLDYSQGTGSQKYAWPIEGNDDDGWLDGKTLSFDETVLFSHAYNFDGLELLCKELKTKTGRVIIWPDYIRKDSLWNCYFEIDGGLKTGIISEAEAKAYAIKHTTPPARAFSLAEATVEIIRLKYALHQIGVACDNQNPTHETIWRIANEALSQTTI